MIAQDGKVTSLGDSAVVAGLGPAPSDLSPGVTWREAPFAVDEPVDCLDEVIGWLNDAAGAGIGLFVAPPATLGWLTANPDVASAIAAAFPVVSADPAEGVVFALARRGVVFGDAALSLEDGFDDGFDDAEKLRATGADIIVDEDPPNADEDDLETGGDGGNAEDEGETASGAGGVRVMVTGWSVDPDDPLVLRADTDLVAPKLEIVLPEPLGGRVHGDVAMVARGIQTLRLRLRLAAGISADAFVDLRDPSYVHHTLDFLEVSADPATGVCHLEFQVAMDRWERLDAVSIEVAETRNWRVHPAFPGGRSFRLRPVVPSGASLELIDVAVEPARAVRRSQRWIGAVNWQAPRRPPKGQLRDAVVFSSWVPKHALSLAEYFLGVLQRFHADSKIFVGVNHDSTPRWRERLEASGLDIEVRDVPPTIGITSDMAGTVAALAAYRDSSETFDQVWFGHTKGISKLTEDAYGRARWALQRWFWDQRDEVEAVFRNPAIGVWAPHWLMFQPEHRDQTDALRRMYEAPCAPLCAMAVSTHFVFRDACLRAFVNDVHPAFFTHGPRPFGGSRYFSEFALPNIPILQGFEPFVGEGVGGTSGESAAGTRNAILNDWRQNNAMVRHELGRWRHDPVGFTPVSVVHARRD